MSDPFFTFPNCPDAQPSPPAIDTSQPVIGDCTIPEAPGPVYQCRLPTIPDPGFIGVRILHIRVTAVPAPAKHDWVGVDMDDLADEWRPNGRSGSLEGSSEALEYTGATVKPGPTVYLAHEIPLSKKVMFTAPRVPFYIRITGGPDGPLYDWQEVVSSGGSWADGDDSGTTAEDPAREGNDLPVVPNDGQVYRASRSLDGLVVFNTTSASAGFYMRTPPDGIPSKGWADCSLLSLPTYPDGGDPADTGITAPVYNGAPGDVPGDSTIQAKVIQGKLTVDVEYCTEGG